MRGILLLECLKIRWILTTSTVIMSYLFFMNSVYTRRVVSGDIWRYPSLSYTRSIILDSCRFRISAECGITTAFHPRTCPGLPCVGRVVARIRDGISQSWPSVSLMSRKSYPLAWRLVGCYILHRNRSSLEFGAPCGGSSLHWWTVDAPSF
jgi:hypothetical protein